VVSAKHNIEPLGVCSYREFNVKPFCKYYFRPGCDTIHTHRIFGIFRKLLRRFSYWKVRKFP